MKKLARREFMQTLGAYGSGLALLPRAMAESERRGGAVEVSESGGAVEIHNGRVRARFVKSGNGIEQSYYARNAEGAWELLAQSLRPPSPRPEDAAPLYGDVDVAREHRLLAADAFDSASVTAKGPGKTAMILLKGALLRNTVEQWVSLEPEDDFFHIEVACALAGEPPRLEYLLSVFRFMDGEQPDFTHVPCLKRAPDDIVADRIFDAPAAIIQKQRRCAALIPDLDLLNREVVYAQGARQPQGPRGFRVPVDPEKISMPAIMDLELKSGLCADPVFAFGFADYLIEQHVFWRHENKRGAMARQLSKSNLRYGFDLFLSAVAPPRCGFQGASQHLWKRYGTRYFHQPRPQVMPLEEYAKACYPAAFAYKGDNSQEVKRYSEEMPYDAKVSGPLATWLEFEVDGKPAGGIRATPEQWYDDIQFSPWWNNVHDAEGMYWWGKRINGGLIEKARRIINLAMAAPQTEGIFPSIYKYNEKRWVGCYWKFPDDFDPNWSFPVTWEPGKLPHFWDVHSDFFQTAAASKTAVYLLRYRRLCEDDPRIVPYARRYGDFLIRHRDSNGCVPAWFTKDIQPVRELRFNAEGGIHIWLLVELYHATRDARYLAAAERMADFLKREVLPRQRWYDFETFYSCSIKPENFYDPHTGQWPQCTLSMLWAIDGFAALHQATHNPAYLSAGEVVADYAGFFQAVWHPHFINTAYAFGGFRSQNSDAEWLDMRQTCFAGAFMRLAELSHRQDLYERGVAAMRASFAIINHPRLIKNDVFRYPRYPFGIGPENIDHEGLPQDPLRSGADWGEIGGLTAAAEIISSLGGITIDFGRNIAVGVDGAQVSHFRVEGKRISLALENQLAALPYPYENSYAVDLNLTGLKKGQYELVIGSGAPRTVDVSGPTRVPLTIEPRRPQ